MKKNMYSLILSEDIVNEVDKLAYSMHTNRSNMINQILAEYVQYQTPEKQTKQLFSSLENIISSLNTFQIMQSASQKAFRMRTALAFKYNPSVRYSIEIYQNTGDIIGRLIVSFRTQNDNLLYSFSEFISYWEKLESKYTKNSGYLQDDKYCKEIELKDKSILTSPEKLASSISEYVNVFDNALKTFFYNIPYEDLQREKVSKIYDEYISNNPTII